MPKTPPPRVARSVANDDLSGGSAGLVVFAVEVLPRPCGIRQSFAPVFTPVKKGRIPSIERRIPAVGQKADPAHRGRDGISCLLGGAGLAAGPIVRQDFPSAFFCFSLPLLPVCEHLTRHGHRHQVDVAAVLPRTSTKINDAADLLTCVGQASETSLLAMSPGFPKWRKPARRRCTCAQRLS